MVVGLRFRVMAIALILAPSARCRHGVWGASVDDEGGPEGRPTMDTSAAQSRCLPSRSPETGFQLETFLAIVSAGVRDQILRAADRTVAKQAPPNIFVRAAFPVFEHLAMFNRSTCDWAGDVAVAQHHDHPTRLRRMPKASRPAVS